MMQTTVTVSVSEKTYELGLGLNKFVKALKTCLSDGFQVGDDIPVILSGALGDLLPIIAGFEDIKTELAEDHGAFLNAITLTATSLVANLIND
jgi:hypothetical protein